MSARAGADPRRVLFVTSNFPRWQNDSTTPFILHLAQDLRGLGWDVHVLAPHCSGASLREVLDGVPVERFRYCWPDSLQTVCYDGGALGNLRRRPSNYAKLPLLVGSQMLAIRRRLRVGEWGLVHSHWILPQGFTTALAAGNVPHVATVHGGDIFALRGRALAAFKRFALKRASAITVNSSASEQAVRELAPDLQRLMRIPMGASLGRIDPQVVTRLRNAHARGDGFLIVFVGRLVEEKGVEDLLEAIAQLSATLPASRALVVGDGPLGEHLRQRARELGVQERVHFAGWVDSSQVASYLSAADVFVGPSRQLPSGWQEAQGLTFAEAMLAGVPVIATAVGGTADTVQHGRTGLLVPQRDPAALAAALLRLHGDPALRMRLAQSARDHALAGLTRDMSARRFSALYEELTAVRR